MFPTPYHIVTTPSAPPHPTESVMLWVLGACGMVVMVSFTALIAVGCFHMIGKLLS